MLQFLNLNHYQPLIWRPLVTYDFENHLPPPHITTTTSPTAKNVSIEHLKDTVKTFSFFFWSFYLLFFTASADAATAVDAAVAETAAEAVLQYLLGPVIESEILRPQTGVLPMSY